METLLQLPNSQPWNHSFNFLASLINGNTTAKESYVEIPVGLLTS